MKNVYKFRRHRLPHRSGHHGRGKQTNHYRKRPLRPFPKNIHHGGTNPLYGIGRLKNGMGMEFCYCFQGVTVHRAYNMPTDKAILWFHCGLLQSHRITFTSCNFRQPEKVRIDLITGGGLTQRTFPQNKIAPVQHRSLSISISSWLLNWNRTATPQR